MHVCCISHVKKQIPNFPIKYLSVHFVIGFGRIFRRGTLKVGYHLLSLLILKHITYKWLSAHHCTCILCGCWSTGFAKSPWTEFLFPLTPLQSYGPLRSSWFFSVPRSAVMLASSCLRNKSFLCQLCLCAINIVKGQLYLFFPTVAPITKHNGAESVVIGT